MIIIITIHFKFNCGTLLLLPLLMLYVSSSISSSPSVPLDSTRKFSQWNIKEDDNNKSHNFGIRNKIVFENVGQVR